MSGEERSRKALNQDDIKRLDYELKRKTETDISEWLEERKEDLQRAPGDFLEKVEFRFNKIGKSDFPEWWGELRTAEKTPGQPGPEETKVKVMVEESKAPAFIKNISKSEPQRAPESQDVIYLSEMEITLDKQVNTLDFMLVPDPDTPYEGFEGPWIERCVGRDPDTKRMKVVRIRAKRVPVEPWMVMQYLGSVVRDHQSVHTTSIVFKGTRWGYVFDRFYIDSTSKKRFERCCLVTDRVHQAGMMYEKVIDKRSRKAYPKIRRIRGAMGQPTDEPAYRVIGYKEADYRDIKRLFERHFLSGPQDALAEDIGLKILVGQ